jgi:hypothetical protein
MFHGFNIISSEGHTGLYGLDVGCAVVHNINDVISEVHMVI